MKKSYKSKATRRRKSPRNTSTKEASGAVIQPTRREMVLKAGFGGLGTVLLGGTGWWGMSAVRATAAEQDLTRIGNGQPAIVQVHDPLCPSCTELQRQTRRAMRCVGGDLLYLVASIRTEEGARFAAQNGVPHMTLLLLDGAGKVREALSGVRSRDELKPIFQAHFRAT